jgi:hypothetical protein
MGGDEFGGDRAGIGNGHELSEVPAVARLRCL